MTQGDRPVLAVDLGGTKASFAVIDADGAVRARTKRPSHEGSVALSYEALAAAAADTVRAAGLQWKGIRAAGVVVPGIYDPATGRAWAPNLWGRDEVALGHELRARLPVPVVIDSDRSGYVLGEAWRGAARGATDVVFLAVGTGIGAGILVDGRLVRGSGDVAGAVGWFALDPRFRSEFGERGCFECEASGSAVGRAARRALEQGRTSVIAEIADGSGGVITAETVFRAAAAGDALAEEILDRVAETMAMGIANIVSILNPEIVVLGGGLFQSDLRLLEPVRARVARWAQPLAAAAVRIEPSGLGEDAGLYGAAKLAWDSVRVWP